MPSVLITNSAMNQRIEPARAAFHSATPFHGRVHTTATAIIHEFSAKNCSIAPLYSFSAKQKSASTGALSYDPYLRFFLLALASSMTLFISSRFFVLWEWDLGPFPKAVLLFPICSLSISWLFPECSRKDE